MWDIDGEARTNSFFNVPKYMDMPVLTNQQELIYTSSVRTQHRVGRTAGSNGRLGRMERDIRENPCCHRDDDNDDDDDYKMCYLCCIAESRKNLLDTKTRWKDGNEFIEKENVRHVFREKIPLTLLMFQPRSWQSSITVTREIVYFFESMTQRS